MKKTNMGDVGATRVLSQIEKQQYDPNMILGGGFTLADLTPTNTGIDNSPESPEILQNLTELADLLGWIRTNIGDFIIHSAYRNTEVNSKVGGALGSLHQSGKAADIQPIGMSLVDMFVKLIDPSVASMFGEIAIKASQGTLHVSTPDPKVGTGKIMKMLDGKYYRLTQDEIESYRNKDSEKIAESETTTYDIPDSLSAEVQDIKPASVPPWIIFGFIGAIAYTLLKRIW